MLITAARDVGLACASDRSIMGLPLTVTPPTRRWLEGMLDLARRHAW